MLQRIQSLFLGLAAVGFISLFKLSFASSTQSFGTIYENSSLDLQDHPALLGLAIGGGLVALAAIFLFNNRSLQIKLSYLTMILGLIILGFSFGMFDGNKPMDSNISTELGLGYFMPLASLLFAFLATIFIKKDNKLVKSMDRLR